mmetsp:Transcript_30261/g.76138  ORF Transcript_30261/g.76138 Transcript_30261/m.76138 type:complete len:416 (+) Transcript_30261:1195-2442(+)
MPGRLHALRAGHVQGQLVPPALLPLPLLDVERPGGGRRRELLRAVLHGGGHDVGGPHLDRRLQVPPPPVPDGRRGQPRVLRVPRGRHMPQRRVLRPQQPRPPLHQRPAGGDVELHGARGAGGARVVPPRAREEERRVGPPRRQHAPGVPQVPHIRVHRGPRRRRVRPLPRGADVRRGHGVRPQAPRVDVGDPGGRACADGVPRRIRHLQCGGDRQPGVPAVPRRDAVRGGGVRAVRAVPRGDLQGPPRDRDVHRVPHQHLQRGGGRRHGRHVPRLPRRDPDGLGRQRERLRLHLLRPPVPCKRRVHQLPRGGDLQRRHVRAELRVPDVPPPRAQRVDPGGLDPHGTRRQDAAQQLPPRVQGGQGASQPAGVPGVLPQRVPDEGRRRRVQALPPVPRVRRQQRHPGDARQRVRAGQ